MLRPLKAEARLINGTCWTLHMYEGVRSGNPDKDLSTFNHQSFHEGNIFCGTDSHDIMSPPCVAPDRIPDGVFKIPLSD